MKIEMGKKYKARNGKDVVIYSINKKDIHGAILEGDVPKAHIWFLDGSKSARYYHGSNILMYTKNEHDIFEEVL